MALAYDAFCPKCESLVSMVVKVRLYGIAHQEGVSSVVVKPDPHSMEVIEPYESISCNKCGASWESLEALAKDILEKVKEEHEEKE